MTVEVRSFPCVDGGMDLEVVQSGLDITVRAGAFRIKGEDYKLADDAVFSAEPDDASATRVQGYLAKEVDGGAVVLVVDEILLDSNDAPSRWETAAYALLCPLFVADVPVGAASLDGVQVCVRHLVAKMAEV